MAEQSTPHIMMMEPLNFHSNPETMETNQYQAPDPSDVRAVHDAAVKEFRAYRDRLVEEGVIVTTVIGQEASPDDVFCNNWISTHADNQMVFYPMLADNRRLERRPELIKVLLRYYDLALDLSAFENKGQYLESTGALCMDRVNKIAYTALSARADKELAERFAAKMGYKLHTFDTRNHAGKPVYHTDVVMYIGTGYAGICAECIVPEDRERILGELRKTHEVIELTMDQLRNFCGNALEVRGRNGEKMLAMSSAAYKALREDQKKILLKYVTKIVHSDLSTIEKYGGGSARCMLLELH